MRLLQRELKLGWGLLVLPGFLIAEVVTTAGTKAQNTIYLNEEKKTGECFPFAPTDNINIPIIKMKERKDLRLARALLLLRRAHWRERKREKGGSAGAAPLRSATASGTPTAHPAHSRRTPTAAL